MRLRKIFLSLALIVCLPMLAAKYDTVFHQMLFDNRVVNFDEKAHPGCICSEQGFLVVANGRIVLTKVCLPMYRRDTRASLKVRVRSNGDPWDKAGSCFVIPARSRHSMIDVARGTWKYPEPDMLRHEKLRGIVAADGYLPAVELLRFMTPFGVGHYSNAATQEELEERMPVYIDGFAPFVEWEQDITDRLPLLQGDSAYVGIAIDTWLATGYVVSAELTVTESRLKADKAPRRHVLPLCNTIQYYQQDFCDIFARRALEVPFSVPTEARNVMLNYVVSGHGGHSGGDEFTPCENIIHLDGSEIYRFTPWRTDCASFRRFNPTAGVWLAEREVRYIGRDGRSVKRVEEPIASSDKSRSGWCPGSDVPPLRIAVPHLTKSNHKLTIDIPAAQPADGDKLNHWLVSAWLSWED